MNIFKKNKNTHWLKGQKPLNLILVMVIIMLAFSLSAHAQEPPLTVGLDMDPEGNSCPNDGNNCTLGTIETCAAVASGGGLVEFDIFLDDLPDGESITDWRAAIGEKNDTQLGSITAYTHTDGTVNLLAQPGSMMFDYSDPVETLVPGFDANVADMGAAEYNPPFTHGTLGRYTLDTTGVADGIYGLTLGGVIVSDELGDNLCDPYGCDIWDANFSPPHGIIAIGEPCPTEAGEAVPEFTTITFIIAAVAGFGIYFVIKRRKEKKA